MTYNVFSGTLNRTQSIGYLLSSFVCPFFHPSVTSRCCTKTAKRRITQTTPHDSPGLQFSDAENRARLPPTGSPPVEVLNAGGVG